MILADGERQIKKILVSIWCRGECRWILVDAVKRGTHYQISLEAFNKLLEDSKVLPHTSFTLG